MGWNGMRMWPSCFSHLLCKYGLSPSPGRGSCTVGCGRAACACTSPHVVKSGTALLRGLSQQELGRGTEESSAASFISSLMGTRYLRMALANFRPILH